MSWLDGFFNKGPAGPAGPAGSPGFQANAIVSGPGAFAVAPPAGSAISVSQPVSTSGGAVALTAFANSARGSQFKLIHTSGNAIQNPVTLTDPNGYPWQDPQNTKSAPVPVYTFTQSGESATWELITGDATYGTFWAAT